MRALILSSLAGLRNWRLWLLQFFGNAVLFAGVATWLLIPEEHWWQLVFAAISGVVIILMFLWLHAGTLVTFAPPEGEDVSPFKHALRHLFAFFVWALVLHFVLHLVSGFGEEYWKIANYLVSIVPSGMRSAIPFAWPVNIIKFLFTALYWYIIPGLFLPFGLVTARGTSRERFREGFRSLRRLWYWVLLAVFVVVGVYVTSLLVDWRTPGSLTKESISMVARLFFAYVLAIACWLMTASLLSAVAHPKATTVQPEADGAASK